MKLVAEHTNADCPVGLLKISVIGPHVDDAGGPAAVTCRERAFVKRHFLHGLRLEDREQTKHVLGVVERDPVQKKQVLVRPASAHVYSRKAFGSALHTRHQLDGLKDIGLAEEDRSVPDHIHRNLYGAHLRCHYSGFPLGGDNRLFEFIARFQRDVDCCVPKRVKGDRRVIITYVGISQRHLSASRNRQGVEAVVVGGRSCPFADYPGPDQRLSGGLVRDVSAHGNIRPLGLGVQVSGGSQNHQQRNCGCDQSVKMSHVHKV